MPRRSLEFMFFLLSLLLSLNSRADDIEPWPGEKLLGQCFADPREAVRALFGENGLEDENITVNPIPSLKDGSLWMVDHTPGHNFAWFLLQTDSEHRTCLTLFVPAACCVEVKQRGTTQTAIARTQATVGPIKQATYQRKKGESVFAFKPASCLKITYTDAGKSSRRQVPCSTRFYYE